MTEGADNRRTLSRRAALATGAAFAGAIIGGLSWGVVGQSDGIIDWHGLDSIRDNPSGTYSLAANLDENSSGYDDHASPDANDGDGWEPITGFDGSFDGNGYSISDLFIERTVTGDDSNIGLFASVSGSVSNLGVRNVDIDGTDSLGALAGTNSGQLSNCYASGSIEIGDSRQYQAQRAGGLVGRNTGTITNSRAHTSVFCGMDVGGFVGRNEGTIEECYVEALGVGGTQSYVGGFVGSNTGDITSCYADVSDTGDRLNTSMPVTGYGGFAGENTDDGSITESYSLGPVFVNTLDEDIYVGGFVGENTGNAAVSHAYAAGSADDLEKTAGGVAGLNTATLDVVYYNEGQNDVGIGEDSGTSNVIGVDQFDMRGSSAEDEMDQLDFEHTWETVDYRSPGEEPVLQILLPDPIGPFENRPHDLSGDGRFDDVNGDLTSTVVDVQALLQHLDDPVVQEHAHRFNYSGGNPGIVTEDDVHAMFEQITGDDADA